MKDPGYEMFIAGISILSVFNLIYELVPGTDRPTVFVVVTINICLIAVFVGDFLYRFLTTPSKSYYMVHDWGWADLLAIAPLFRVLRLIRVAKAYRFVSRYGTDRIRRELSDRRAELQDLVAQTSRFAKLLDTHWQIVGNLLCDIDQTASHSCASQHTVFDLPIPRMLPAVKRLAVEQQFKTRVLLFHRQRVA